MKKESELKVALKRILAELKGVEDLTTAEKNIMRIAQKALFNA